MQGFALPGTITAILFDKDGTLIDFEQSWSTVNTKAAQLASQGERSLELRILEACGVDPRTGRTRPDSLFAAGSAADIARQMVAEGSKLRETDLTRSLDRLFESAASMAVPAAPLGELFSFLRKMGIGIGIASSDNEKSVRLTAKALGVHEQVDFFCGYDTGYGVKPEPGMVFGFSAAIGCQTRNVAVVGDNRHDMEMGRKAGAGATVGVLSGTGTRATLAPLADICIESVAALPALLGDGAARAGSRTGRNISQV